MKSKPKLTRLIARLRLKYQCLKNDPAARLASKMLNTNSARMVIYAGGAMCKQILSYIDDIDPSARPRAIFDRRATRENFAVSGMSVLAPEHLSEQNYDVIVVASEKFIGDIILSMEKFINPDNCQIVTLLNCAMNHHTGKWSGA